MQKNNLKIITALLLVISMMLSACASKPTSTTNLSDMKSMGSNFHDNGEAGVNNIRFEAVRETALSLGARGGLAWRAERINHVLEQRKQKLSQIFDFDAVLLKNAIMPPVLVEGHNTLKQDSDTVIRISDRTYRIIKQARFATTAPTWREYLMMNYEAPEKPDNTLLPKTAAEARVWKRNIETGWNKGVKQANAIFGANLGRLQRDYRGMALYRKLLAQKMVSAPYVSKSDLGVTGNGSELNIHDQILRITALPTLKRNSNDWNAVLIENKPIKVSELKHGRTIPISK